MPTFEEFEREKRKQISKGEEPTRPPEEASDIGEQHRAAPDSAGYESVGEVRGEVKTYKKADLSPDLDIGTLPETDYEKYLPEEIKQAAKITNLPEKDPISKTKPTRGFFKGIVEDENE
jgi:hypothetical protein